MDLKQNMPDQGYVVIRCDDGVIVAASIISRQRALADVPPRHGFFHAFAARRDSRYTVVIRSNA